MAQSHRSALTPNAISSRGRRSRGGGRRFEVAEGGIGLVERHDHGVGAAAPVLHLVHLAGPVPDEPAIAVHAPADLADDELEERLGLAERAGWHKLALPEIGRRREARPAGRHGRVVGYLTASD